MRTFKQEGDWIFEFESAKEYLKYLFFGFLGRVLGLILFFVILYLMSFIWS